MIHVIDGSLQERNKYAEIWDYEQYRTADSPGLTNVDRFMSVINPAASETIIDIGCGAGQAGLEFGKRGLRPYWLDITDRALDPAVARDRFIEMPLWGNWHKTPYMKWDYGFCCDVMEHIPHAYVMLSLDRILSACHTTWFQICNLQDKFGPALLGQPLHLTVQPFGWWLLHIATIGKVLDARDLCGTSMFVVTR